MSVAVVHSKSIFNVCEFFQILTKGLARCGKIYGPIIVKGNLVMSACTLEES